MVLLILLNLLLIFFSTTIAVERVKWNPIEISRTVKPDVRRFEPGPNDFLINHHYHYKIHFGIIIKKNSTFTLKVKSLENIEELYFYCLTSSPEGSHEEMSLAGKRNFKTFLTLHHDCVPMTSVSHNVPVEITIKTKNWANMPVFDIKKVTFLTSQEAENAFYEKLQTYGFVVNHYTQMLISFDDVRKIKLANYSLYHGLQNQADIVQYYDYLIGASRYTNENEPFTYNLLERSSLFLRRKPCDTSIENSIKMPEISESSFLANVKPLVSKSWSILKNKTLHRINPIYDKCENVKIRMHCDFYAYYSSHWIAITTDVSEFLNPTKGSEWVLLHEIGHNYDIAPYEPKLVGLGDTSEVWNNIFATLYQYKFSLNNYWINSSISETKDTISKYQKGVILNTWNWRQKLHFYMSLFGFDGTDSIFREFHIRYYQRSETKYMYFNNIIPILLEVFLDLHKVNILPYLRKVVNFNEYTIPLINEDLELRLLSENSIMPAIDFNVTASDLQTKSKERDFRYATPLMLLSKLPKYYVWVKFHIKSPIHLFRRCMYLNNHCYYIPGQRIKLKLLANIYSIYIIVKIREKLYVSDVEYHTLVKNMIINVAVKEIRENEIFLPLIYYSIDAYGYSDSLFARTFINYKNNEIAISQFTNEIHYHYLDEVYCSLTLKRNDKTVFDYVFFGESKNNSETLANNVHKFEIGDILYIYHHEMERININGDLTGVNCSLKNNTFVFTPVGIHNIKNSKKYEIIENDVKRIINFMGEYNIDLSYNVLFKHYIYRYARSLNNFSSEIEFPTEWLSM